MGFPLYVTCCFSLAAFSILSLCLVFFQFDQYVSWRVSPWVYPVWDSMCLLELMEYFLFHVGKLFNYNLFKNFCVHFLSLFFFWEPCNSNVGAFDIVPDISQTILSSFHSSYFILLFKSYFNHFIFQVTYSFCFRYSAIDSFQSIFNFSNCVVCLCMFILQFLLGIC